MMVGFTITAKAQDSTLFVSIDSTKSCVKYDKSSLITFTGTDKTLVPFFKKLDNLKKKGRGNVNIWHVGGSHVQAGSFSGRVRNHFASKINGGKASRTIMFPYSLIGTNGPTDYSVTGGGTWTNSKCTQGTPEYELGLSGITAVTSSPDANIKFEMKTNGDVDWKARKIIVLGKANGDVKPYIVVGEESIKYVRASDEEGYVFYLPEECSSFSLWFHGLGEEGTSFELRGVIALNDRPGVAYWASGVNGAATSSWLRCSLLEEDLKLVSPDLVIFGIGINDAHTSKFKPDKFKERYQLIIDMIKAVNPKCHFLFVTNNDNLRNKAVNPNTAKVEQVFMELAKENDGSVWDLYKVMGGYGGSRKWVANKLMKKDHIHFTRDGYQLIGDLMYNAIIEKYLQWSNK
jgi:lysophospholipase L1-like esterase